MYLVFICLISLIALALIVLALIKGEYQVSRSLQIQATQDQVFTEIENLTSWPKWSPWLLHEPNCDITYSESPPPSSEGGSYRWNGKLVGEGMMTHKTIDKPHAITQKIQFFRPMKSTADVTWKLQKIDQQHTEVTWSMSGKMPFLMRPMARFMDFFIGKDYELGLALLARELGDKDYNLSIDFSESVTQQSHDYIYLTFTGKIQALKDIVPAYFDQLTEASKNAEITTDSPFALYYKINPKKQTTTCRICLPLEQPLTGQLKKTLAEKQIATDVLQSYGAMRLEFSGDYRHLSYIWPCAFSHLRMKKLKQQKSLPVVEKYISMEDPTTQQPPLTFLEIPTKSL